MGRVDTVVGLTTGARGQGADAGLPVLRIENPFCRAEIAFQGAQILQYTPTGQAPLLWLSPNSHYRAGKAIRGGIPLCFPWFGAHPTNSSLPAHGFARLRTWQLAEAVLDDAGHLLLFRLEDDEETRALWPHPFIAELEVRLGRTLTLTLRIRNRGSQPLSCSFALHSYFAVADVRETIVIGLTDTSFNDQLAPALGDQQQDSAVLGFSAETDRIYPRASGVYQIQSLSAKAAPINISAPAGSSVVIWNPWQNKAARLGDMPADDWQHMLCVECGQLATEALALSAGETTEFTMTLTGLQR